MIRFINTFFDNLSWLQSVIALSLIYSLRKSLGHVKSSQSSLVVSWQRICNSLAVLQDTYSLLVTGWLPTDSWTTTELSIQSQSQIATDGQSVCLSPCRAPAGAHDRIFLCVWKLLSCPCGALSLMRGRVCSLQLLLVLASAVIFGSKARRTRGHILLSRLKFESYCPVHVGRPLSREVGSVICQT
jgi:hypothetical protein